MTEGTRRPATAKGRKPQPLAVRSVPIASLTIDPANARKHGARNLAAIKESLAAFGQRRPLVITKDRIVIAGNGTLAAAVELGWTEISVSIVPASWTLDQARAYALADNRTAELASWDGDLLDEQLQELDDAGWDMAALGFDNLDVDADGLDAVPDVPAKPITKPGDCWILGDHRLVCGSASDAVAVARAAGNVRFGLVVTDPPYGVEYGAGRKGGRTIENDDLSEEDLRRLVLEALSLAGKYSGGGTPIYMFHAEQARPLFQSALEAAGWQHHQTLVWVKDRFVLGRVDYHYQHEPILYGWKPGGRHAWFGGRRRTTLVHDVGPDFETWSRDQLLEYCKALEEESTVVRHDRPSRSAEHPTMKPVTLLARLITASSRRGGAVYDPFLGSGSTLIAAEHTGRICHGVEIDPGYCDVAVRRWEVLAGKKAKLAR